VIANLYSATSETFVRNDPDLKQWNHDRTEWFSGRNR